MVTNLIQRSLELAAGTQVNLAAYEDHQLNLAKVQCLGKAYRQGWLHNVLRRITPLTARQTEDYVLMAELFITTKAQAELLLQTLSQSLTEFATVAGVSPASATMRSHRELYQLIAQKLEMRHGVEAPSAFASTTITAQQQAQIPFVRHFLQTMAA